MARLTAAARKAIPSSKFAGPGRSFPIEDPSHARAALSMAHNAADPAAIKAAVHRKYPQIGQKGSKRQHGLTHGAHITHPRNGRG